MLLTQRQRLSVEKLNAHQNCRVALFKDTAIDAAAKLRQKLQKNDNIE
jgi:hypothetical protein